MENTGKKYVAWDTLRELQMAIGKATTEEEIIAIGRALQWLDIETWEKIGNWEDWEDWDIWEED